MKRHPAASSKFGFVIPGRLLALVALVFATATAAYAVQPDVNVVLRVTPGTSMVAGSAATLTATVSRHGAPITTGSVRFCNANVSCTDAGVIGTAQVTSNGKATMKLVLGAGDYAFRAHFNGLGGNWAYDSAPHKVKVSGNSSYKSATAIQAHPNIADYTLTATVSTFGHDLPTGTVSFVDASKGNLVLATASLDAASLSRSLVPAPGFPLSVSAPASFVATGDFNGDGVPDLAILGGNRLTIFLGKGDGTFRTPITSCLSLAPAALAVADFNGDGQQDLVVANAGNNTISILLGKGDGTFLAPMPYGTGRRPSSVEIADVNWDGIQDLIVGNSGDDDVSVFLGNGDGTFQAPASYRTGRYPQGIAIGDFNGDGYPDIATANAAENTVTVLLGNGDGTFGTAQAYTTGANPESIKSGDLNGDGITDLVVANHKNSSISVLIGNGDGTFKPRVSYPTGAGPMRMTLGDFNGDNVLDVAIANATDNTVSVLLGRGDGTFQPQMVYPVAGSPMAVAAADFNGDGLMDIVTPNVAPAGRGTASVFLGAQTETATALKVRLPQNETQNVFATYSGDAGRASSQSNVIPLSLPKPCDPDHKECGK